MEVHTFIVCYWRCLVNVHCVVVITVVLCWLRIHFAVLVLAFAAFTHLLRLLIRSVFILGGSRTGVLKPFLGLPSGFCWRWNDVFVVVVSIVVSIGVGILTLLLLGPRSPDYSGMSLKVSNTGVLYLLRSFSTLSFAFRGSMIKVRCILIERICFSHT